MMFLREMGDGDSYNHLILQQILEQVAENNKIHRPSTVVFDLDSTLFDVRPRIQEVLGRFVQQTHLIDKYPNEINRLSKIRVESKDWGIRGAVTRAGLADDNPEVGQLLKDYWQKHFFSHEFLHFDEPYEGAVEYVEMLLKLGTHIVYLTGRDDERMGRGSIEVLHKWGFPLQTEKATLVLKPQKGMDDAEFKSDWFRSIPPAQLTTGKSVWLFENEPANISKVRADHSQVGIVFVDSTHAGKEHPPTDVPWIKNFILQPPPKSGEPS